MMGTTQECRGAAQTAPGVVNHQERMIDMSDCIANPPTIPYGYCHCGCGTKTSLARQAYPRLGVAKGEPYLFANGHRRGERFKSTLLERFMQRLDRSGGEDSCWEWNAGKSSRGYGTISVSGSTVSAHRFAYEHFVDTIPDGMFVCHTCDNPSCCNPAHLFLGTALENNRDRNQKGRANFAVGERTRSARLTVGDVLEIRRLYRPGDPNFNQPALARRFDLSQQAISDIVNRRRWKHLLDEGSVK